LAAETDEFINSLQTELYDEQAGQRSLMTTTTTRVMIKFGFSEIMRRILQLLLLLLLTFLAGLVSRTTAANSTYGKLLGVGIAIPEPSSNPGISGLKTANPGIPVLIPGLGPEIRTFRFTYLQQFSSSSLLDPCLPAPSFLNL